MKRLNHLLVLAACCLIFLSKAGFAGEPIRIVTTTSVLADMAEHIAGSHAKVFYIASPKRDIHKIAPTPKDVLKTKKADVFIYHGAQLEVWLQPLLNAAGRNDFFERGGRSIDVSAGIELLEVPDEVHRIEGDIHPHGNPHYWLDPSNVKIMLDNITRELSRLYPEYAGLFQERKESFQKEIDIKAADWEKRMKPFEGAAVITYHRSWSYFAKAYGLNVVAEIEPKPGIPVTGKHLGELRAIMRKENVRLITKEPFHNSKPPKKLSKETGVPVIEIYQFVGAQKGTDDFIKLMEYNISQFETALSG